MWREYNPNPTGKRASDCAIRAVAKVTGMDWGDAYIKLCALGYALGDLPNADHVWGAFLQERGFRRGVLPDCPQCLTVAEFADAHPHGSFALGTGSHAVAVADGDYYDAWDSGNEIPIYFWKK